MSGSRDRCLHRRIGPALLLVLCALFAAAPFPAAAAPRNSPPVVTQPPPVGPAPAEVATVPAVAAAAEGLCQCIAQHEERRSSCLPSPAVCQSTCGSTHYSFVPYAVFSCSLAAEPGRQ